MNDSKQRIADIDAPDAEVELSAQDLFELAAPGDNNNVSQAAPEQTTPVVAVNTPALPNKQAAPTPAPRHMSPLRVAASVAFVVGIIGAMYFVMSNDDASESTVQARVPHSQLPAAAPEGESQPVLFANPFDANEVFEFPAGTSQAKAREQVAEILMERAMKRQRQFDARVSSNR